MSYDDVLKDIDGYGLNINIFGVSAYISDQDRYERFIIQAKHAGEAIEIFYSMSKKDSIGRWPIPMSVDHIGKLENPSQGE